MRILTLLHFSSVSSSEELGSFPALKGGDGRGRSLRLSRISDMVNEFGKPACTKEFVGSPPKQ